MTVHVSTKQALFAFFAIALAMTVVSCGTLPEDDVVALTSAEQELNVKGAGAVTHDEYVDAPIGSTMTIEAYVQARQDGQNEPVILYLQDPDGAYFCYNVKCDQKTLAVLEMGQKVRITGTKQEWWTMPELMDCSVTPLVGTYVPEAIDVTDLLGADELSAHQAEKVIMRGLTVEASADKEGNDAVYLMGYDGMGDPDDDLVFSASKDGKTYKFVVEPDLSINPATLYKDIHNLRVGDVVDVECFLYWFDEEPNPHVYQINLR